MKKWIIILVLTILFYMGVYGDVNVSNESETADAGDFKNGVSSRSDLGNNADGDEEEVVVDASNRTIIAEALGVDENSRNIRFILGSLKTICAGKIQRAEAAECDGEKVINLVAEDGTKYRVYLSASGSVEAVENLDTGEWPIQSKR